MTSKDTVGSSLKNVVVATDIESWHQAIYVDGVLVSSDDTIYAGDIESAVSGQPCLLRTMEVSLPEYAQWPDSIDEVVPFEE